MNVSGMFWSMRRNSLTVIVVFHAAERRLLSVRTKDDTLHGRWIARIATGCKLRMAKAEAHRHDIDGVYSSDVVTDQNIVSALEIDAFARFAPSNLKHDLHA